MLVLKLPLPQTYTDTAAVVVFSVVFAEISIPWIMSLFDHSSEVSSSVKMKVAGALPFLIELPFLEISNDVVSPFGINACALTVSAHARKHGCVRALVWDKSVRFDGNVQMEKYNTALFCSFVRCFVTYQEDRSPCFST